ncbi:MAG: hypothetical protein H6818_22830 [Phycisphaerales bacterium]|nr:hypothetical protein [Phycisphaerales bacterium]
MTDNSSNPPRPRVEIDLEPLPDVVVDPNVGYQAPYYPGVSQRGDYGIPVPDRDGHLCPNCNYDVRGLSGRICPECGQHFTIAETLRAGHSNMPDHKADAVAMSQQRWTVVATILLFVAGFFLPCLVGLKLPTWGDAGFRMIFLMPFALMGIMYSYCLMRPSREAGLVAAILYAVFSFVLEFL